MNLPIDFAGDEPESALPSSLDPSAKLTMQQAEELLLESVKSDVQNFMIYWKAQHQIYGASTPFQSSPAELTANYWYQEFYAWMGV